MSRINIPSYDDAPEASKPVLDAILKQLGVVPNLFRLIGNSSVALNAFSGFQSELGKTLDVKTHERIALAVAQVNGCNYCLSAHTYLAQNMAKLTPEEITLNRNGSSLDNKAQAAVAFAHQVASNRGHVSSTDISNVRAAGYSDAEIVEIVALVAQHSFTNYLNEVAKTEIDFPEVHADQVA